MAQSPVDGIGRRAFVRHDAVNFSNSVFRDGYSYRAVQKDDRRRPAKQASGERRLILETLSVEAE